MKSPTFAVFIPARYKSSRFPGKPLVNIAGKPMIHHVWERCAEAVGSSSVYVATDDSRIEEVVKTFGGQVILTSEDCLTGTDRIAEANRKLGFDFVVNVQGDEPLVKPSDVKAIVDAFREADGAIVNAMSRIESELEFRSLTVPKVVTDLNGKLLYMSRSGVPLSKSGDFVHAYKQVCIYAFSREHLEFYVSRKAKTPLESIEDIEILRFVESGYHVQMVEVESGSVAVDTPEDLKIVRGLIES